MGVDSEAGGAVADEIDNVADLTKLALEAYREEYRDLSETWKHLDTKAQSMGAIAGIFLAAAFAWARDVPSGIGDLSRGLLAGSIALLVATIVLAVFALLIRQVAAPPLGDETADMVQDILEKQKVDEAAQRLRGLYNDQMTAWKDTNTDTAEHNRSKAGLVAIGQTALVLAAILVAVHSIIAVLSPGE